MKSSKKIITIIGVLFAIFIVIFIVLRFVPSTDQSGWKHYTTSSISKDTDENSKRDYAVVDMDKTEWENASAHNFISSVSGVLDTYKNKNYTTFLFDDGTGLMFPGSSIQETAFYGKADKKGNITTVEGYVQISGQDVSYKEAESYLSEDSTDLYSIIPDEYSNDSTYVNYMNNIIYARVVVSYDKSTNDVANELFENAKKSGKTYDEIHIQVNDDAFLGTNDGLNKVEKTTDFIQ